MKHGSLFSGIGGFDLAAEWMGWENIFHCEIAEFPRKILKYHFPNSICYEDIKKTDFTKHRGEIDIISGGFPCQPYSNAGKRKGKEDDRHLWPEMLQVIREIQPRFVVGENVSGLLSWNNGMVFHEIITDLENEGYETQAFLIPACATNAPHRRDRIWFVAHARCFYKGCKTKSKRASSNFARCSFDENKRIKDNSYEIWNFTDTDDQGLQRGKVNGSIKPIRQDGKKQLARCFSSKWQNFPTQPPICGRDDGIPTELDGITFPKWRNESIKGYGNAVVPQVVYQIFKAIEQSIAE